MKQKTVPSWLLWMVWLTAGLCIAAVVILAVLATGGTGENDGRITLFNIEQTEVAEEESRPEEIPATEYPIFDIAENPYTVEDFDFRGRYLACTAGPCRIGIDVSAWQNEVNWPLVKAAGMEFAMIRTAWRGSTAGTIKEDKYAEANYRGAKDAGLDVGCYVFSQAITPEEAVEEAEFVLQMVEDWELEMPIVFDWEQSGDRTANMDGRTLTDCALAFCQRIEEAGYEAMVYFNKYQAYNDLYMEELEEYGLWLAMYTTEMTFPYKVDMWQYSQYGSVPGIEGDVDLNIQFLYE